LKKVIKWFAPYNGLAVTFSNQQPRTTVLAGPALDESKEVAPMVNIKNPNRTQLTSDFGMSMCGRALVITRDWAAANKGHIGLVPSYVPGTNAWSPPVC
jgi:hypothetical protein